MLHINDLTYRIGGRPLFEGASAVIPKGHKVALVGRNGTGKTTLLRLIAGELAPDGGSISLPAGARMGIVRQEVPAGGSNLLETVLAADEERTRLLVEAETADDPHRIAEIHTRLADIGAHSAEARAAEILNGLGFDADAQRRPASDFSGGWRMRVALASVLFVQPDLLLLDEPTNHLDLEATVWLEGYLKAYPHTILMVSHDRDMLNKVPTTIVHLERGKLTTYSGNFDNFVRTRAERLENARSEAAKVDARRKHMQAFVDRFRYKATKARQAQSRLKALEKLGPPAVVIEAETMAFDFPSPDPLPPPLLTLDGVAVGYDGRAVLRRLNLRVDQDDRIALLGSNGNGKSTLVKLLAGRLQALEGEVRRSGKLKVGYFAQHQTDELNVAWTPVRQMQAIMPDVPEQKVRSHLGRFGFSQGKAETLIGSLSGGEKARLLFALMSRDAPHILLLDEPTNHLDVESREALVEALNAYEGAVILISHDPHLIELTADRLWVVADGGCKPFDGDLDDYRRWLVERRREARSADRGGGEPSGRDARRQERRSAAELRAQLAPLRKRVGAAEKLIEKLGADQQRLEARLADPTLYSESAKAELVTKLQRELGTVRRDIAAAEEEWMAAQEELESAAAEPTE
jgi:ATP-binding cassette subfamily F protein 3